MRRVRRGQAVAHLIGGMAAALSVSLMHQFGELLLLSLPVACASWTVTHEEVFREPREYCHDKSQNCRPLLARKFFYLFTCEYCFSHYISLGFLWLSGYQLLYEGWRGYLLAWFALVWVANVYMSVFNRLRLEIKATNVSIQTEEAAKEKLESKLVV